MKLHALKRIPSSRGALNQLRKEGHIPAVLYKRHDFADALSVCEKQFQAALKNMEKGSLPTTTFTLLLDNKEIDVLVKGIEYHPTNYKILHLDFLPIHEQQKISVNVPIRLAGETECVGVKLGGFVRPIKRHVKVSCLPNVMPKEFTIDIQALGIGESKKVSDLSIDKGIQVLSKKGEILVTIAKR